MVRVKNAEPSRAIWTELLNAWIIEHCIVLEITCTLLISSHCGVLPT